MTNITLNRSARIASVESLLWKYGNAMDGDGNYKQVYNIHSQHDADAVDNKVLSDSYKKRVGEVMDLLRDFTQSVTHDDLNNTDTVILAMPSRWQGRQSALQSLVDGYIDDGMMADWLSVTSPSASAEFITRLQRDETNINLELYHKRQPQ